MSFDEISYGILPLRRTEQGWMIFLVQLHAGHWGFPKGHTEEGETPLDTAKRELFEETQLTVQTLLDDSMIKETYYHLRNGVKSHKLVGYFIAEVTGDYSKQNEELADAKWVPLHKAEACVSFNEAKAICRNLEQRFLD